MKPFRKEKLGKNTRSRYEIAGSEKELSRKLFDLKGMDVIEAVVKLEPEELMPHEEIKVASKDEFERATKGKPVSSVKIAGSFKGHDLIVSVDYGLSLLSILSDDVTVCEDVRMALDKQKKE